MLNPVREKERLADKGAILDVKARDGNGTFYNIEVQVLPQLAYRERCLFYAAAMVSQQLDAGDLSDNLTDSLDCWILFLRHAAEYHESAEIPEPLRREEGMVTAMEATHKALSNAEIRYAIEARKKAERDRITELNAAVESAEARGKAEGETVAKSAIARELRAQGLSDEFIARATGLSPEDF